MDLSRMAAGLLGIGFDGPTITPEATKLIHQGVGGVILFKRNIQSSQQFEALTRELKQSAPGPLWVAIDQEGGRVQRLREPFTPIPSMRALGQTKDPSLAFEIGRAMARELRAVHVDWNFAPVMDVDSNPANPVIGDRSFGPTAELVAMMGCALLQGLQAQGIAACAKHFPGHGDTSQDSHLDLPRLSHNITRLREVELPPFEAAIRAGVASIMTAHVIFDALDPKFPATMSRPALDGILRDRMRFGGVVVSDDLEMKAIADHFGLEEAMVRGINAGVDLFLVCHHAEIQERAIEILVKGVESGKIKRERLEEARGRVERLVERFVRPAESRNWQSAVGCEEHRRLMERVAAIETQGMDPTQR
jgi:beta-N-acetylhexosaminidase